MLQLLQRYQQQAQQKAKEFDQIEQKMEIKKAKIRELKKVNLDLDNKNQRLKAKLVELGKFSQRFIKSMQSQHLGLKDKVQQDNKAFQAQLELTTCQIVTQLTERLRLIQTEDQQSDCTLDQIASLKMSEEKLKESLVVLERRNGKLESDMELMDKISEEQTIRIANLQASLESKERSYKVIVDELSLKLNVLTDNEVSLTKTIVDQAEQIKLQTLAQQELRLIYSKAMENLSTTAALNKDLQTKICKIEKELTEKRPLEQSDTISLSICQPKDSRQSESNRQSRSSRVPSICSSEKSHQIIHSMHELVHQEEASQIQGESMEKQLEPRKKDVCPDMAPRPINPTPRPMGQQQIRQPRPVQPIRPQRQTPREESPKASPQTILPRANSNTNVPRQPKTNVKMHADPFVNLKSNSSAQQESDQPTINTVQQAPIIQKTQPAEQNIEMSQIIVDRAENDKHLKEKLSDNLASKIVTDKTKVDAAPKPVEEQKSTKEQLVQKEETKINKKDPKVKQNDSKKEPEQVQPEEGRFSAMINSLLSYLGRKKRTQAFLGQSASKMRFDESKGRYVFEGESSSEEEVLPEPPKAKKVAEPVEETKEEKRELTGTAALTQVAFGGALSGRGRGRGRGSQIPTERFASQFSSTPLTDPAKTNELGQKGHNEQLESDGVEQQLNQTVNETFVTTADQRAEETMNRTTNTSINMTLYTAQDQSRVDDRELLHKDRLIEDLQKQLNEVENIWKQKCSTLQDKIKNMSRQLGLAQTDLDTEKQQTQQTIEGMETFIADLKIEGEIFQSEIFALKQKLELQTEMLANSEFKLMQISDEHALLSSEIEQQVNEARIANQESARREMELEMLKVTHQMELLRVTPDFESQREQLELQGQIETLKWQRTLQEIEIARLSGENALLQGRNSQLLLEIESAKDQSLVEERKFNDSIVHVRKEQVESSERERDQLKELVNKLTQERDRLQDSIKDRERERDVQQKKLETEKKELQRGFQKALQDKESSWQEKMDKFEAEKQDQIRKLDDKLRQQAAELQKQEVKRTFENKRTEKQIKQQLESLEGILTKKEEDLSQLQGYNQEVTLELASMGQMREKLQEHIIYLQNEIRKRDELLEEGSELVDIDLDSDSFICDNDSMRHCLSNFNIEDDINLLSQASELNRGPSPDKFEPKPKRRTLGQVLKGQLEDNRNLLKVQVELKLRAEVRSRAAEAKVVKLNEGLQDILQIMRQNVAKLENDTHISHSDDRSSASESGDHLVQQIIGKLFKITRSYEAQRLELQHQLDKAKLQLDDTENIKFDLEFALDEKQLIESELEQLKIDYVALQKKVESEQSNQLAKQVSHLQSQHQRVIAELSQQHIAELEKQRTELETEVDGLMEDLSNTKEKYADLRDQNDELTNQQQDLALKYSVACSEIQRLESSLAEVQRVKSQLQEEIENTNIKFEEAQEEIAQKQTQFDSQKKDLLRELAQLKQKTVADKKEASDQLSAMQEEIQLKDQSISKIQSEVEQIVNQFVEKKDSYKSQISKLKAELKNAAVQLQKFDEACEAKQAIIDRLESETQTIIEELKGEVEIKQSCISYLQKELATQREDSRQTEKNAELVEEIQRVQHENQDLKEQLASLEEKVISSAQLESDLQEASQQIEHLQRQVEIQSDSNAKLRADYLTLKEQSESISENKKSQSQVLEIVQSVQSEAAVAIEKLKKKHSDRETKLKSAIQELNQENENLQEELAKARAKIDQQPEHVDETKYISIVVHEAEIAGLQQSAKDAIIAVTNKRNAKEAKLKETINELVQENQALTDQMQSAQDALVESKNKSDLNDIKKGSPAFQAFDSLKEELEVVQGQKAQLEEIVSRLNAEMGGVNELLEKSEAVISSLVQEKATLTQTNQQLQTLIEEKNMALQAEAFDTTKHISVEQHEIEMRQLQQSAQEAITAVSKKRDAKEAKLKEALNKLAEDLEHAQSDDSDLKQQLELLTQQRDALLQQAETFQETENQYRTESERLAAAFAKKQKSYKDKIQNLQEGLKELFDEHEVLKAQVSEERDKYSQQTQQLLQLQLTNETLVQSLDLTKVQINDETSKYEAERQFIEDQCQEELKKQEKQLRQVLIKIGVQLDSSPDASCAAIDSLRPNLEAADEEATKSSSSIYRRRVCQVGPEVGSGWPSFELNLDQDSFEKLVEKCGIVMQNYLEDRRQLRILLEEREEKVRAIEDLEYKLERLMAEKEFMTKQMDESQVQKLKLQINQMEEERQEMRNDFFIKFNSYSEEISGLKDRLTKYEPPNKSEEKSKTESKQEPNAKDKSQTSSGGLTGFVASLFLTESEMARRV